MFGDELVGAFREFKSIWDPDWKMNPARSSTRTRSPRTSGSAPTTAAEGETHFAFPRDGGSFAHATTRCVGIGNCRRPAAA
jgi:hypothetical protein